MDADELDPAMQYLVYEVVCPCGFTGTDENGYDECPECGREVVNSPG